MKQKRAKNKFGIILVIFALLMVLTLISFPLPTSDYDYNGFIGSMTKGVDYTGGTVINFSITDNSGTNDDMSTGIEANLTRIKNLLQDNYYNCNTYVNGDYITVELIKDYSPLDISQIINSSFDFYVTTSSSDDAEKVITSDMVETAYAIQNGTTVGLYIGFNDEGATAIQNATSSGSATLYFTIGDKSLTVSVSEAITNPYILVTTSSYSLAESYAATINASRFDFTFNQVSSTTISSNQALVNAVTTICVAVALIGLTIALFVVIFKKLGLIGILTMLFALIFEIILFQSIPNLTFTAYSFVGFVLVWGLGILASLFMFDKMHQEYKLGKKLYASVRFGYDKSFLKIIDLFVFTLIISLLFFAFGSFELKSFAISMALGSVVYPLCVLLLNRWFVGWYLLINPTKAEKYGFSREEEVDELA